jgi:adenosylcobinamide-GDP ribazoletransferase
LKSLRDLVAAFSYFSILPVRHTDEPPDSGAILFLPLVGALIGVLSGYAAYGIALLTHSVIAAAITAWALSIALSGAIHVDGFLDCCDGLFAMATPQRRLEIMRDPRHGTYAIVGMSIISVLWLFALAQIPPASMPLVLAVAGLLGRYSAIIVAGLFRNVRTQEKLRYKGPAILVNGALIGGTIGGTRSFAGLVAGLLMIVVALANGIFASRRLGGVVNGDCYGASVVVTEVVLLLAYPALTLLR